MTDSVLFVGAATYDAIAVVDRLPGPDERLLAETVRFAGGGPAATAAVAARRLGLEVELLAAVGADEAGEHAQAGLRAEGVSVAGVQVEPERPTQTSVILCTLDDGGRSIATRRTGPLRLDARNRERVRAARLIHVDHLGWPAVAAVLEDVPAERRPRIVVDAGNPLIGDDAHRCRVADVEVYAPPWERLRAEYPGATESEVLRAVPSRVVVATRGAAGSVGRDAHGNLSAVPGLDVPGFVSTLGAGDVFHGALTAATFRGLPLAEMLTYANTVAALSCRGVDGRSAIPSHDETIAHIQKERA